MRLAFALTMFAMMSLGGCHRSSLDHQDSAAKIVWVEQGLAHDNVTIDLGYRSNTKQDVTLLEPVVRITRNGAPVADAMVFDALVAAGGNPVLGEEQATVYETPPNAHTAIYAQGRLHPHSGTSQCTVRFRIVLPDSRQPWTRDVTMPLN